jgi:predicted Zn-dependent protease
MRHLLAAAAVALTLTGCATNPVTGKNELHMVSEAQEIQIGEQQYGPGRQSQGGDYVTDPKVTEYVRQVGNRLAAVADRKLPYEFVVVNDSSLNAWALPGGKIAVNRGLLVELNNEAELAAVVGHEIVHAAARHGAQQMEKGQFLQLGAAIATIAAGAYGGGALGDIVGQSSAIGAQAIQAKFGRDDELEADKYGMKYMKGVGYDLQSAVSLQELFVRKFEEGKDQDWMTGLFASHPPSQERVAANQRTMAELGGPGGDLGRDRYMAALGGLKNDAPAYQKYDDAMKAATKKDFATARKLATEASRMVPRESRFYSLLGELEMVDKDYKGALGYFTKANQLDPNYFKPMVQAGMANYELGNKAAAEPLLKRSMDLLPSIPGRLLSRARLRRPRQYGGSRQALQGGRRHEVAARQGRDDPSRASRPRAEPGDVPGDQAADGQPGPRLAAGRQPHVGADHGRDDRRRGRQPVRSGGVWARPVSARATIRCRPVRRSICRRRSAPSARGTC